MPTLFSDDDEDLDAQLVALRPDVTARVRSACKSLAALRGCDGVDPGPGSAAVVSAQVDGGTGLVVFRRPVGESQGVELYVCGDPDPAAYDHAARALSGAGRVWNNGRLRSVEDDVPHPPVPASQQETLTHMSTSTETRNVIIIGSGPSGYTAAVYAARASLNPLVFEGSVTAGGALMNTTEVENFPGFRDGIMGPALMDEMRAQAERFGAELVSDDVVEVDLTGDVKVVKTATDTYTARSVILATGSGYRKLGLPREDELSGRGVSWCATCDGFFFREQAIAVVGGGDSAIEEATFLTRFGSKVYLIHRREELRASKIMQERAFADPKLEMVWNSEVAAINGADKLESITLRDTQTGEERDLPVTGLFIAIGHDPRSELLTGQVDLDDDGYVLVDHPSTKTNLPGVFAAGDLVDHHYRQAITAAGTGCAAALDAERFIAALDHEASTAGDAAATVQAIEEQVQTAGA